MKRSILSLAIILSAFLISCTDDFEEINTRQDAVNRVDPGIMFNPILQNPTRNYQRNINLYPDLFAQYWANTISGFESPRYEYVDGWIGNRWREFYTQTLAEANTLIGWYGEDPAYTNALAQLDIWMVAEWARIAQIYGDLPYFGAGMGENVAYNSEQEIYYDLFDRLTAAVNTIDSSDLSQYAYSTDVDLIYRGDLEKWKRFGNSLRLRLAMRLANVDPSKAQAEASAAVTAGVMMSNDDSAILPLWNAGFYDYLHQMGFNWDNIRISKTFADLMYNQSGSEDPRASILLAYESGSPLEGSGTLQGLVNGYDLVPENGNDFATLNLDSGYAGYVRDGNVFNMTMPIMFHSEVAFLKAEAALRGWIPGDANALYQEGIQASMDYVGVDPALAADYINAVPAIAGADEASLKQLITQKYIANFPNGEEAWADFRRTDYPDITLPIDGVSSSASVAADTWVKRVRYPDAAHNFESEFMPASRNTIPMDRMDIKLWWDTTDTKTKSGGLMNSNF